MAIPKIIFTESFQQLAVATYPIMNGGYNDPTWVPDDMYVPNGQLDVSKIPLLTVDARGLVNGGNCGVMLYSFRSDGNKQTVQTPWSPTYPFGAPLSSTALSNQIAPVGFSVVPCPTRPGRKRFRFPGKKLAGRPLPFQYSTEWRGAINCFSLRYNIPSEELSGIEDPAISISFVVRFPERTKSVQLAWYASIGYPSLRVNRKLAWRDYGLNFTVPGFFASYAIFGSSRVLNLSTATPTPNECYTPGDTLPWLFLGDGGSLRLVDVPNPTSPGLDGDFFKFDTNRDYHIEIKLLKNGEKYWIRPKCAVLVDGVMVKNYSATNPDDFITVNDSNADNLADPDRTRTFISAFQFNFQMNHWSGGSNSTGWFYPDMTEECGPMMLSDIIYGAYPQADEATYSFGPTTRVWGESPNTDVKTSFNRPDGFTTNASVVGNPMKVNTPSNTDELSGSVGDSDEYKTDGSSMPDFAGTVLAIQLKTVARAESADGTIISTFDGNELGEVALSSVTGSNYSTIAHTVEMTNPMSPSEVAEKPFGFKVKEG